LRATFESRLKNRPRRVLGCFTALVLATLAVTGSIAVAQAPPAPQAPQSRFTVVLDAAHGGDDTGGHFKNGQLEKSLTLAFTTKLRSLLAARGINVVTTRDSDATVDDNHRIEVANHAQALACLSLHAAESGSGVHLFASSLSPAPTAHLYPWKTAQAVWVTRSLALTGDLNSALQHASVAVTLGRTALPTLDSMACPAVAIEISPERIPESATIKSAVDDPGYQTRVAEAIAAALLVWRSEAHQP